MNVFPLVEALFSMQRVYFRRPSRGHVSFVEKLHLAQAEGYPVERSGITVDGVEHSAGGTGWRVTAVNAKGNVAFIGTVELLQSCFERGYFVLRDNAKDYG